MYYDDDMNGMNTRRRIVILYVGCAMQINIIFCVQNKLKFAKLKNKEAYMFYNLFSQV